MRFQTAHTPNSLTEGPIAQTLIAFALPLFLGNLFQQLYNTADSLIVGNFLGSEALAARRAAASEAFLRFSAPVSAQPVLRRLTRRGAGKGGELRVSGFPAPRAVTPPACVQAQSAESVRKFPARHLTIRAKRI